MTFRLARSYLHSQMGPQLTMGGKGQRFYKRENFLNSESSEGFRMPGFVLTLKF